MELVVLVGIPASGKSTESMKYRAKGYRVVSSDEIRNEIMQGVSLADVSDEEKNRINKIVFETVYAKTEEALQSGESVVVDATHLGRIYRVDFLEYFKEFRCAKKCLLFVTPFETCLERNRKRNGPALVPDDVMFWMLGSFECPELSEGWDEIVPVISDAQYKHPFTELRNFEFGTPEYEHCRMYLELTQRYCQRGPAE